MGQRATYQQHPHLRGAEETVLTKRIMKQQIIHDCVSLIALCARGEGIHFQRTNSELVFERNDGAVPESDIQKRLY
jgi:hypothetical protein